MFRFPFLFGRFRNKVETIRQGTSYPNDKSVCKINITQPEGEVGSVDLRPYQDVDFTIGEEKDVFEIQLAKNLEDMASGEKSTLVFRFGEDFEEYTIELKSFIPGRSIIYWTNEEIFVYCLKLHETGKQIFQSDYRWAVYIFSKARELMLHVNRMTAMYAPVFNPLVPVDVLTEFAVMLNMNMAICLMRLGKWRPSIHHLDFVLNQDQNHEKALYSYGLVLKKLHFLEESLWIFKKLINLYPYNSAAKRQLHSVRKRLRSKRY